MQYERKLLDSNVAEYAISGDFTIFFLNSIKSDIEKDINSGKIVSINFDFKEVSYIDSAAISLLIMSGKFNDSKGKTLLVKRPRDVVKRIIDNAELTFVEYQY
jgi:anti-anti-sigma regulatory factor